MKGQLEIVSFLNKFGEKEDDYYRKIINKIEEIREITVVGFTIKDDDIIVILDFNSSDMMRNVIHREFSPEEVQEIGLKVLPSFR